MEHRLIQMLLVKGLGVLKGRDSVVRTLTSSNMSINLTALKYVPGTSLKNTLQKYDDQDAFVTKITGTHK